MTEPALEHIPIDQLVPYARNSRMHSAAQIDQIAASIREFGFTSPVLIDGQDGIIAGHGRILAGKKAGMTTVPCLRLAHLSDAQRRAYVIADNKLAMGSFFDPATLASEMADLIMADIDMAALGFTPGEAQLELLAHAVDAEPRIDWAVKDRTAKATQGAIRSVTLIGPLTDDDIVQLRKEWYGRGVQVQVDREDSNADRSV